MNGWQKKQVELLLFNLVAVLWLSSSCSAEATIITSVSFLFEAFSPYSMIRFFEFSDKGWNISDNCLKDMYDYLEGLRHGAVWAIQLYDASGYYGGGAFGGSRVRMQDPKLCRHIQQQYRRFRQHNQDNLSNNASMVPFPVHIIMGHYILEIKHTDSNVYKREHIQQSICFPQACTETDLKLILEVYLFQGNDIVRNSFYLRHRIVNENFNVYGELDFYILIAFICFPLLLYGLVYLMIEYGYLLRRCSTKKLFKKQSNIVLDDIDICKNPLNINVQNFIKTNLSLGHINSDNLNQDSKDEITGECLNNKPQIITKPRSHILNDLLEASAFSNIVYELFCGDDMPLNGVFVIFTILWIYVQLTAEVTHLTNNSIERSLEGLHFLHKHSSFIFDIYFFVGASQLAYTFLETFPTNQAFNVSKQLQHILKITIKKLLSLQPSYTFCLFAEHLLDDYFHNSVSLELPTSDYKNCRNNKINNILYLDTFIPVQEKCMPWTWFMSLEVLFFIIACLVLLLSEIHPRYAVIIGVTIFGISIFAASFWELHPQRLFDINHLTEEELMQFHVIFDNIYLRIAPYLLGLCLGYLLYKNNATIHLNIFVLICGWLACIIIVCFFLFGYEAILEQANPLLRTLLVSLGHTMWSMILLWVILTSLTQYGAQLYRLLCFSYSHTMAKLSHTCLLIAPMVIRLFVFTADAPIYSSKGQIFVMAIGCLPLIYFSSFLMHVLWNGPLNAMLEVILQLRK